MSDDTLAERARWKNWLLQGHYGFDWWNEQHPPMRAAEYAEAYYLTYGNLEQETVEDYIGSLAESCGWTDEGASS